MRSLVFLLVGWSPRGGIPGSLIFRVPDSWLMFRAKRTLMKKQVFQLALFNWFSLTSVGAGYSESD